jgi:hypothetical protein
MRPDEDRCRGVSRMSAERDYAAMARRFVEAVTRGADDEVTALLTDDVLQEEFPNRLLPTGATQDLAATREAGQRDEHAMARRPTRC